MITHLILLSSEDVARLGGPEEARSQIQTAVLGLRNVRSARLTVVVDDEQRSPFARGKVECAAFLELDFDTLSDMRSAVEEWRAAGDLGLLDGVHLVIAKKVDRAADPADLRPGSLMRVSLLGRADGISAAEFQTEWWGLHSEMVRDMPGYVRYVQNLVLDRHIKGQSVPHSAVPVDGIVEFWFPDREGFDACYASDAFSKTAKHGAEFLQDITTYLVETTPLEINET